MTKQHGFFSLFFFLLFSFFIFFFFSFFSFFFFHLFFSSHLNSVLFNLFSVWIPKSIINPFTNYDVSGKVFFIFARRVSSCLHSNLLRILTSNKVLKSSSFSLLFLPTDIGRKLHKQCAMVDSDGVKGKNYEMITLSRETACGKTFS